MADTVSSFILYCDGYVDRFLKPALLAKIHFFEAYTTQRLTKQFRHSQ